MDEARNRELVHIWFEEVWNRGRAEAIDEMVSAECLAHGLGARPLVGSAGFKAFHAQFKGAFPDIRIEVGHVLAEGDMTAVRFTGTATHTGDHLGLTASNTPVTFTGMSFQRWKDGRIVEGWNNVDIAGILQQIGAMESKLPV